jgi:hypothetical protein
LRKRTTGGQKASGQKNAGRKDHATIHRKPPEE